ncbi:DEAD/DEAH box helicase [Aerococcus urinae]
MNSTSFVDLINKIDDVEHVQRDRGTMFEILVKTYLKNEPMYVQEYSDVWLLNEVPEEYGIPKKDTGVDLVAKKRDTKALVGIQAKYFKPNSKIYKENIDSFLNEIGKKYYDSGLIVSSTNKWSNNANDAIKERNKDIQRIGLSQLADSKIDWSAFSFNNPTHVKLEEAKKPRSHQKEAISAVLDYFKSEGRGKLIMAPGSGKTYTSLVIAEEMAKEQNKPFKVLYLVPSIQLLSQALRGWSGDASLSMKTFAVCSDRKVTKNGTGKQLEDISSADIGFPATTDYEELLNNKSVVERIEKQPNMVVVFSTYQSIDVISDAQKHGFYDFDLIISDEAHRTTGVTFSGDEDSHFVKVHYDKYVKGEKRLYQTATPRVYGESAVQKAEELSAVIADMDDEKIYGKEIYRLGFGEAVHRGILTDYKVLVLAVDEEAVQNQMQRILANEDNELQFNDVAKIIGTWNGLLKRKTGSNDLYGEPMKRAIAFTGTIEQSKLITEQYNKVINEYLNHDKNAIEAFSVEIKHADGSMNALEKNGMIDWLKSSVPNNTCRILSNARFLTEGVDVPDLDAVMFMQPRRSTIDIAQAVGRVMRRARGKDYGYVILPIGIPSNKTANEVLDHHQTYQVVWDVLNALRSIDERFDAIINQIELNKKKPKQIDVIGVDYAPEIDPNTDGFSVAEEYEQYELDLYGEEELSELEKIIYAKVVKKVGTTRYWETWSKDVAELAQQHITRITAMVENNDKTTKLFKEFIDSLKYNINDSITKDDAIEMLAQHMITRPVFDALFEEESFALNNPVSKSMSTMVEHLEDLGFDKELDSLSGFYESVKLRAEGIDNLESKQTIIIQLYEKFFKIGFPRTTDSMGIVFTPTEVVDFIINSVNDALQKYVGKTLSDKNVNILDPFTGTGTFITRLLQSGIIKKEDLTRKYSQEIYANEIVLLSYYIAAINIEETFKEVLNQKEYIPFEGIVLTDTFEQSENSDTLDDDIFGENNARLKKQQQKTINVIIGNPPYSSGASSDNDDAANKSYPYLDESINKSYAKYSSAKMKKSLYDSYIRAFRWASNRLGEKGVIGFVTNGSFIDSQSTDGLRKVWYDEFNAIFILNLRGDARTQGEARRKEAGNVFGSGSRTPVAITILVKDGSENHEIYYKDIGEYLSREEKLSRINDTRSIKNIDWTKVRPNKYNDWINQRDENYQNYPSLVDKQNSIFNIKYTGVNTSRDSWVYGFSKDKVIRNVKTMVKNYNMEIERLQDIKDPDEIIDNLNLSPNYINWSRSLRKKIQKKEKININNYENYLVLSQYRPFVKKWLFYQKDVVEMPGRYLSNNIQSNTFNLIQTTGKGSGRDFSALIYNHIPNFHAMSTGQGYMLENKEETGGLKLDIDKYNISDGAEKYYELGKEDLFYYIYALFHSRDYLGKYRDNLIKETPRIPKVKHKEEFVEIGKQLANLHINYELKPSLDSVKVNYKNQSPSYKVNKKMKFAKKKDPDTGKNINDQSKIIFNSDITIENIPEKAYEYVVNGRSAIEWIMDQYQIKTDKKSGLVDDPNEYSKNPKYILNLLLSIINVSVQTVDLVNSLPELKIIE